MEPIKIKEYTIDYDDLDAETERSKLKKIVSTNELIQSKLRNFQYFGQQKYSMRDYERKIDQMAYKSVH